MSARLCALSLLVLLAAAGCRPRTVSYELRIVTIACEPQLNPMEGVTHFRLRLTGDGLEKSEKTTAVALGELQIPEIPSGKNRQVEVRAFAGDPGSGGVLISVGRSLPFDVPDVVPEDVPQAPEVPIFLRKVNVFTPPSSFEKPGTCTRMRDARAGHTATLLPDGRVFIAGGYQLQSAKRVAIAKAEIFNPITGDFSQAQDLGFVSPSQQVHPSPRAFHTATTINPGQVLLIGGETYTDRGDAAPVKLGLFYDPPYNDYGVFVMMVERTRHAMAKDKNDRILIVGGTDKTGAVVADMEWYDPNVRKTLFVTDASGQNLKLPRIGHSMAAVQGGEYVAVAGGSNGTLMQDEVYIFKYEGQGFVNAASQNPRLREKRRGAAMVPFQDLNRILLAGGFDGPSETSGVPIATTEILDTGLSFAVRDGPVVGAARGEICAAQLADGRVVTIGGLVSDPVAGSRSDSSVEVLTPSPSGPPTPLRMDPLKAGRHFHSCTTLQDGSVLVLGGISVSAGTNAIQQDALIFTPAPLD